MQHEAVIQVGVVRFIHGAYCADKGYGTAVGIEYRLFAQAAVGHVERHGLTGCREPKRVVAVLEVREVIEHKNLLLRQFRPRSMSAIVHHERAFVLLLVCHGIDIGIVVTRCR